MKKLSILLVLTLIISLLSACGGGPEPVEHSAPTETPQQETAVHTAVPEADSMEETAAPADTSTAEATAAPDALPITENLMDVTIWAGVAPDMVDIVHSFDDLSVVRHLETITNIHLEATLVSAFDEDTKFPLMIASGDYCDIIAGAEGKYASGADGLVAEGICIDLRDKIEELAPTYAAALAADDSLYKATVTDSGTMASFYSFYTEPIYDSTKSANHWIRGDWLEELSLEMPTTYQELHDVLSAFHNYNRSVMVISSAADEYLPGYGISDTFYLDDSGAVAYGAATDTYREYLTMLNQWYEEGLIYQDFYTESKSMLSDTSLYITDGTGIFEYTSNNMSALYSLIDGTFPAEAMPEPTIRTGDLITCGFSLAKYNGATWTISTACENVEAVMAYIDYMYSDACTALWAYGLEDEAYTVNSNGGKEFTELILNNPDGYSQLASFFLYTISGMSGFPGYYDYFISSTGWNQAQFDAFDVWSANYGENINQYPSDAKMTTEEASTYAAIYTGIETYQDEMVSKFIVGSEDIMDDTVWNRFVESIHDMGIDDCVAIKQASYQRYLAR